MVDIRLNILNDHVDYFVISESTKTHQGKSKKINFDPNRFSKFKNKIKFVIADYDGEKFEKHIGGESPIEQHQRNSLIKGIKDASPDDLIILSDADEIPDLKKISEIMTTINAGTVIHNPNNLADVLVSLSLGTMNLK